MYPMVLNHQQHIKHLIPPLANRRIEIPQQKEENSQNRQNRHQNDLKVKSLT